MWSLHPQSAILTWTTLQIRFNMTFYAEFTTFVPDVTSIWSTARNKLLILLLNKYVTDVALNHMSRTYTRLKNHNLFFGRVTD